MSDGQDWRLDGAIESKSAEGLSGWIAILPGAEESLQLEVVIDGEVVGRVAAMEFRADVKAAGYGSGCYGFSFRFPASVPPQAAERALLRLAGTEIYLTGKSKATSARAGEGSVFILGPPRSGTSAILMGLHRALGFSAYGEGHALPIFQRLLFGLYEYVRDMAGRDDVMASHIDVDAFKAVTIEHVRAFYHEHFNRAAFVDKTPGLEALVGVPFLREAFPAARLIVTQRRAREFVESHRRKFGASFETACVLWARCAEQIETLRSSESDILFVDHHELESQPDAAARAIAAHVGKPEGAEALTRFFQENRVAATEGAKAAEEWTEQELRLFEKHCERRAPAYSERVS